MVKLHNDHMFILIKSVIIDQKTWNIGDEVTTHNIQDAMISFQSQGQIFIFDEEKAGLDGCLEMSEINWHCHAM